MKLRVVYDPYDMLEGVYPEEDPDVVRAFIPMRIAGDMLSARSRCSGSSTMFIEVSLSGRATRWQVSTNRWYGRDFIEASIYYPASLDYELLKVVGLSEIRWQVEDTEDIT
jgi:hypothetical protein